MGLLLLIIVLVLVFGGLPRWGYHSYGYAPSGIGAVLLIILIVLLLSGRLYRGLTDPGWQGFGAQREDT
jgi:hypothetical protein